MDFYPLISLQIIITFLNKTHFNDHKMSVIFTFVHRTKVKITVKKTNSKNIPSSFSCICFFLDEENKFPRL